MSDKNCILGGGCFWCLEAFYQNLAGVESVVPGYAGGKDPKPNYESVCAGITGHAEVIKINYNDEEISFQEILDYFWKFHDPTTLNRQGHDAGTQYRSIVFYDSAKEKEVIQDSISRASTHFASPIATELKPTQKFFAAEAYHHAYYNKNPSAPYCLYNIAPKLDKLGL